jgi:hypothetical protein
VVLVLVAGALYGTWYSRSGPSLPQVVSAVVVLPSGDVQGSAGTWAVGPDGRPAAPVRLAMDARISLAGLGSTGARVLGMAGPGISERASAFTTVTSSTPVGAEVSAGIDCALVPLPVPDYRLQVRVQEGSRVVEGPVAAGALGKAWAAAVDQACGSWLARRYLTVTAVTGRADPLLPRADLSLTVTNSGSTPATLANQPQAGGTFGVDRSPGGQVRVPAHGKATLRMRVDIGACDSVPEENANLATVDTRLLAFAATTGPLPPVPDGNAFVEGTGPTGVVFGPTAVLSLVHLLGAACGNVTTIVTLLRPGGVTLDPANGLLTLSILIDMPPGAVSDLRLTSDGAAGDAGAFTPLWKTVGPLVPDRTGQAAVTLTYRAPPGSACPFTGTFLPGFSVVAHVPGPAGVRTLRYGGEVIPWEDPASIRLLCPGLTLTQGGAASLSIIPGSTSPSG